jgi:hypothetical protein
MTKTFSLEEALKPSETTIPKTFSLEDAIKPIDQPSGNIVKDLGISALQGLLGAKEAAVGIANLPTFGLIGKTTEAIEKGVFGGTSKDAREALQKLKSETQQSEEQRISEAFREEGILPGLKEAVTSPRVIASSITESLPSMIGGAAIGRKALQVGAKRLGAEVAGPEVPGYLIKKFGPNVAPIVAGAFGEAAVSAGAISEATRQEEDSGYLNPKQVALSTLAGGLTGAFGILGGKVAKNLNIGDVDTMLIKGTTKAAQEEVTKAQKSTIRKAFEGALSESTLEELPQSLQEQALQNIAQGKDWKDGLAEAGTMGFLVGGVMGGGANLISSSVEGLQNMKKQSEDKQLQKIFDVLNPKTETTTPAPAPTNVMQADQVLTLAQKRLNEIETKMNGTPDVEGVGPDGQPMTMKGQQPQIITDQERAEYDFLKENVNNAPAIASTYGITIGEPKVEAQVLEKDTAPKTISKVQDTSHDTQAMLDELSGKDIELTADQFQEDNAPVIETTTAEEPTGIITEEDKQFTPVGGRLITEADVAELSKQSAEALQQNLAAQEAERDKQIRREIREDRFPAAKTPSLATALKKLGGINQSNKLDMIKDTGKVFNYESAFSKDGEDLLTHIESGSLDEYLPHQLRLSNTPAGEAFDPRPGYDFISSVIESKQKVHDYDYELAKIDHENKIKEKYLARQSMTPNEAARAAAAETQEKIFMSEGKIEGSTNPVEADALIRKVLGKEGQKLLDNNKLKLIATANDLDAKLLAQISPNTRAFYDPTTDTSYIITDRVTPNELRPMILHEVGVHYGMKKMLGDKAYKNLLANILKLRLTDKAVQDAFNTVSQTESYAKLLENENTIPEFLEEVLAHLGETAPTHNLWKRIVQAVKTFLIKNNIIKKLSVSEVQDLVTASLRSAANTKIAPKQIQVSDRILTSQRPPLNIKGQEVLPKWHGPEESKIDTWLYNLQNKQIDTMRVQQAIGNIEETWNLYEKEQLYHGRTASGIRKFLLKELLPVIKEIERLKISPQEIRTYLHNRHAEERNNQMNKINPGTYNPETGRTDPNELLDIGSGISTADARAYLAGLDPAKKKTLENIAEKFDQMVKGTQQILVASGAESQDTINKWNKTYKHYVPLFRVEDDMTKLSGMSGTGAGMSTSGSSSKRALGSTKDVQDILSNIIAQRERALIRAEKIRVGRALYGMAILNPNSNFWLAINPDAIRSKKQAIAELKRMGIPDAEVVVNNLMAEPKERYLKKVRPAEEGVEPDENFDFDSGLPVNESKEVVASKVNVMARYQDYVFPVRINGKDRYIFFNKNDPRAMRMVQSLKNLDVENLGIALGIAGKFTRWFKNVNTQYNPVFGLVNFIRDTGGALLNLTSTEIAGEQAKVIAGAFKAMGGILNVHRAERKGKPAPTGPWATLYQEARDQGFQTGYRDSLIRNQEEMQIIEHTLEQFKDSNTKKAFYSVIGGLTDFNDVMENAIRLSAYKVAIDKGLSKQKAAIIAKNLTVNFDKKGAKTAQANALFAFFNASVQGTERIYQTIKGPKGKMIIGGGILAGMVQAVMLAAAGYGDDDPPEFVREKNFIIPLADGTYITIPYPLGFNILPNSGRIVMDFMIHGGRDPGKHSVDLLSSVVNSFNPLGSTGLSLQTLAPTIADPLVALAENKDAFGRPISRKDRATAPTPGYTRSRDTASEISKGLSYYLNLASGGSKYQKGYVSPTADEIDFFAGQIGGGLYREVTKAGKAVSSTFTGEEVPAYQRPVVGRFIGETGSQAATAQTFYENITRMTDHENEIKGRKKNKESVPEYLKDYPEARLWRKANSIENEINALNKQKRLFIEKGFPKERIQAIDAKKTLKMKKFNDQYEKARAD